MKFIKTICVLICSIFVFTACSTTMEGEKPVLNTVASSLSLTTGAVYAYKTYSKVENIIKKYNTLFTQEEITRLATINTEFKKTYVALKDLKPNVETIEKVTVTVAYFDDIYGNIKKNYTEAKNIIYPKIDLMDISDKITLLNFDRDVVMIDKEVDRVREKIKTELANKNINTVDITNTLRQIATFAQTMTILLATF